MIKIDKDVPLPNHLRSRNSKYPLRKMEVGDSFLDTESKMSSIASAIAQFARRNPPAKFTCRKMEAGGYRVWRIK